MFVVNCHLLLVRTLHEYCLVEWFHIVEHDRQLQTSLLSIAVAAARNREVSWSARLASRQRDKTDGKPFAYKNVRRVAARSVYPRDVGLKNKTQPT